jgi:hypothetical protein
VVLLTIIALLGWQAVKADWLHRLISQPVLSTGSVSDRLDASPTVKRAPTQIGKAEAKRAVGEVFQKPVELASSGGTLTGRPVASTLADLNNDGRPDLVTAFENSLVTVRAGLAKGGFDQPTSFSIDAQPTAMAVADVTGDGHLDVLVADRRDGSVLILVGNGRGELPAGERVALAGAPSHIVVRDVLGDQRAEVFVTVSDGARGQLVVWSDVAWTTPMEDTALSHFDQRTLATTAPSTRALPISSAPVSLGMGLVDSNSLADLVLVYEHQIVAAFGDRAEPFGRLTTTEIDRAPRSSAFGDFNGDAKVDVALLVGETEVIVYSGTANGQFNVSQQVSVAEGRVTALAAADLSGDRLSDLVLLRYDDRQVGLLFGQRGGNLDGDVAYDIAGEPMLAVPGWLDNDVLTDLAVIHQRGVSLLLTRGYQVHDGPVGDSPITAIDPLEYSVEVPEGQCRTVPIRITIAPTVFRPLDIYLLADASSSFNDNIEQFKRDGEQFVNDLLALRGDIRLGVGKFRDYPISPFGNFADFAYQRVLDLQQVTVGNRVRLVNAIRAVVNAGGGDGPESQLAALFQAATGAGQDVPGLAGLFADIAPNQQASFRQNVDVEKIVVLVTDNEFHECNDPGTIPYPGPCFADTVAELNRRGIKVVGIASGGPGGNANVTINALRRIAEATGTLARRDIDCDGNGSIDIRAGQPIVCPPPAGGARLKDIILSAVRGFDLPVPLTLEIDRDCSPATFMIDPPVQFVNPLTGGTFTFNITFCCPCGSAPHECRFETKVILDEIIRARIPSRLVCVRPQCETSPATLDFGDVCPGQSADQIITIRSTGNGAFTVNQINSSNPAFTVAATSRPLPATLAPGESMTATIRFTCNPATGAGEQTGTISFVTDPPRNCVSDPLCAPVPVRAFCVQLACDASPRSIDFGNVFVGSSADRTFTVSNNGNRDFTITAINSSNPAFTIMTPLPVTVPVGGSAQILVRLTCTARDRQDGVLTFTTTSVCGPVDCGSVGVTGVCDILECTTTPTVNFGDVCAGTTATQTATATNTGNVPFTVTTTSVTNPARFTVISTTPILPATLNPGESVTATVQFNCAAPSGAETGQLTFVTNPNANCPPVQLSGTCVQVACVLNTASLDFGQVCVGQNNSRNFTVTNPGNRDLVINSITSSNPAFSVVNPVLPVTIPGGTTATMTVVFSCTSPGAQSGTLSFNTSSSCGPISCGTISVSGFCVLVACDVAPRTIDFGAVCVGAFRDQTITVSNSGNGDLTINAINSTNPAFSVISPLPVTVPGGGSVPLTVRFSCASPGPQSGTLSFSTSSSCGPIDCGTVAVSGVCQLITGDVNPRNITFGDVCVGSSADQTFTITNTGNAPFTVTTIMSSNPAFSIVSPALPVTIPVGGSVVVTVRFTCTSPGPQAGTISFTSESACGPVSLGTVNLTGFCAQVGCSVVPVALNFGAVFAGTSVTQTVTVNNSGNIPFTINAVNSTNAAFAAVSPLPVTIAPGASADITIRFSCPPGSSGPQSGTLSFSTSSACGPVACGTVSVSGECFVGPICVPNPGSINFGPVIVNQTQQTGVVNPNTGAPVPAFSISNMGDRALVISAATSTNPRFTVVTPLPVTIPAGGAATLVLQFEARELSPPTQMGVITFTTQAADPGVPDPPDCSVNVLGDGIFGPLCIFVQPLGTPPDFNWDLPFPDIVVGSTTLDNGLVQVLNLGDQDLIINLGGQRPRITNLSFTIEGFDLDGVAPLDFPLSPNPAVPAPQITIAPGDLVFMQVRFTGLDIGPQVGAIQLFGNEPVRDPNNPPCVLKNVRGNVVRPPQCELTPTSVTLNAFAGCSSDQVTVSVANTGGLNLVITNVISDSADVTVTGPALPVSVPSGGSVAFTVRCTPTAVGTRTSTVQFVTNDPNPQACRLSVTCVATRGPVCQVVMPDAVNGSPDGKTYGEVAIIPMGDPRFGTVGPTGLPFGEKRLPIEVRNVGDSPLVLIAPPAPFPSNPFVTNVNFIVEGFSVGDTIAPGAARTGTVIFRPTLRRRQEGTIRFFTNTCVGECVITGVNGIGVTNALCQVPISLNVGSAPAGGSVTSAFLLVNRGDRPLVISDASQIVIDNPRFTVTTPLPIIVPPEFMGGDAGVPIAVRFAPTAAGEQIGRITLNFNATEIGPVGSCTINVSGTGTEAPPAISSTESGEVRAPVPITGANRPSVGLEK